jgi:hypothetical protein
MNLIFVCTRCTYYWRKEEDPSEKAAADKLAAK